MFPNLKIFISGLMCLPHASAAAERVFSQLNLIKSKTRNRLKINTCSALLHVKEMLEDHSCFNFKHSSGLLSRNVHDDNTDDNAELTF